VAGRAELGFNLGRQISEVIKPPAKPG